MLILAIETSGDLAGLALADEHKTIAEHAFSHRMNLLRRLVPNIELLLQTTGKTRKDINGVVISLGPGSFTGLRIGMATAKAIAFVREIPIVGVSTLQVLAEGAGGELVVPLIHARAGEVFWAIFERGQRLTEDSVSKVEDVIYFCRSVGEVVFCGDGAEKNRQIIEDTLGAGSVLGNEYAHPKAGVLAALGVARLTRGESDDVDSIVPSYVKRPTPVLRMEGNV
jgi:tRNA threonylcarbamoyladenosine biosynthesis protein TsaB